MSDERPPLRIVRGQPTAEEIAVLTAVVSASGGGEEPEEPAERGAWSDPAALLRRQLYPGHGGWRHSLR